MLLKFQCVDFHGMAIHHLVESAAKRTKGNIIKKVRRE